MLIGPIDKITETDLQALVAAQASESATLDFKRDLPGATSKDKYEFAKDACALANSGGGDLVYGIDETDGFASRVLPLVGETFDAAKRRLGMIADAGIEPRIPGIRMEAVMVSGGYVLIVRVPASFNGPHRIVLDGHSRFVVRNNTHTTELSYDQLRDAFNRMNTLSEKANKFKAERLNSIVAKKTGLPMRKGPIAVALLVPLQPTVGRNSFDITAIDPQSMLTWVASGAKSMRNLDGFLVYETMTDKPEDGLYAYAQVFRNGAMEAGLTATQTISDEKKIPSSAIAKFLRNCYLKFTTTAQERGLRGPAVFSCSLLNIGDYQFAVKDIYSSRSAMYSDRPQLTLPDGWIEALDSPAPVDDVVKPILDVMWEAFDASRCFDYDKYGNWSPQ
ncbi:MAG: helix-turn-helix domain-containing protein [Acidovorax sp.]|uniref:AlbA family DNA-binding domain-containing protein n=1 Tax=Acidovorax sp. TaxID=1872122 RepID=UPI00391D87C2